MLGPSYTDQTSHDRSVLACRLGIGRGKCHLRAPSHAIGCALLQLPKLAHACHGAACQFEDESTELWPAAETVSHAGRMPNGVEWPLTLTCEQRRLGAERNFASFDRTPRLDVYSRLSCSDRCTDSTYHMYSQTSICPAFYSSPNEGGLLSVSGWSGSERTRRFLESSLLKFKVSQS